MQEVSSMVSAEEIKTMNITRIARLIQKTWVDKNGKSNVNYAAKPYLEGMLSLFTVDNFVGIDSGKSTILYFLSNASSFRGEQAKIIKDELKRRVK